jgi:hypothetical protein
MVSQSVSQSVSQLIHVIIRAEWALLKRDGHARGTKVWQQTINGSNAVCQQIAVAAMQHPNTATFAAAVCRQLTCKDCYDTEAVS